MKFLFFIIVFIAFTCNSLFSNWEKVYEYNDHAVCIYISNNNIYVGARSGILLSKNNGFSWDRIFKPSPYANISAITGNENIIVAGGNGGIYISYDKGNNWIKTKFKFSIDKKYALMLKDEYIYAASSDKGLLRSSDFGETWTEVDAGFENKCVSALLVKDNYIFATINEWGYGVYRSSDNGNTWLEFNKGMDKETHDIRLYCLASNDDILYAGGYTFVYISYDNGVNWIYYPLHYLNFSLINYKDYIIACDLNSNSIFLSKNNFQSYQVFNEGIPDSLTTSSNFAMNDEYIFIAYGIPSTLYRMKISDISSVNNDNFSENQLILYPNPAKQNVSIDFMVEPENLSNITVELYNLTGILQSKLDYSVDYNNSNGQGTLNCNIGNIANGYYIIVINNGKRKEAKPFIVNKDIY